MVRVVRAEGVGRIVGNLFGSGVSGEEETKKGLRKDKIQRGKITKSVARLEVRERETCSVTRRTSSSVPVSVLAGPT